MFDKDQLVNLRNLSLGLHANAGLMITVPTNGAIAGRADQDEIRIAMQSYLNLILIEAVHVMQALGKSPAQIAADFDDARASA